MAANYDPSGSNLVTMFGLQKLNLQARGPVDFDFNLDNDFMERSINEYMGGLTSAASDIRGRHHDFKAEMRDLGMGYHHPS